MSNNKEFKPFDYRIFKFLAKVYTRLFFKRKPKPCEIGAGSSFFIVSNHQTDFDIAVMVSDIKEQIRPVASEHIVQNKSGKLLRKIVNPITVTKGSVKVSSVRQMLKAVKHGENLMIHPEGTRTFDGITMDFGVEIGKVIKASKAALVTYNIKGGYLCTPKWALNKRKGHVYGNLVNIYTKEEIKDKTPEEIADIIKKDIYVDDYEENRKRREKYTGKGLAEGIENLIFICPKCGKIGSLYGKGDYAVCDCGFESKMDEYGFFDDEAGSVTEWGKRQIRQFEKLYDENISFSDENVTLLEIRSDHSRDTLVNGTLKGNRKGICIGDFSFNFDSFEDDFELISRGNTVYFTVDKVHYILASDKVNMYKYQLLFQKYKNITLHT